MAQISITHVRYTKSQARKVLEAYIFGGRYSTLRPPRGLPPDLVALFLTTELKFDSAPRAYQRALEAMRFYEVHGVGPILRPILAAREKSPSEESYADMRRAAYVLQALGDLGPPEDAQWGADYFDRILLAKPGFADNANLLLQTLLVLAPAGSPAAFSERLRAEIARSPGSQVSRTLRETTDNRLPGTVDLIAAKKRLLETPFDHRRPELISIYLGQSDLSEPYMVTWAARMIRREAMESDPTPIYSEFGRALDALDPGRSGDPGTSFAVVRAAQAIIYLQGKLTPHWRMLYESSHPHRALNFLWDDV